MEQQPGQVHMSDLIGRTRDLQVGIGNHPQQVWGTYNKLFASWKPDRTPAGLNTLQLISNC